MCNFTEAKSEWSIQMQEFDFCVVGAGIAGLGVALPLCRYYEKSTWTDANLSTEWCEYVTPLVRLCETTDRQKKPRDEETLVSHCSHISSRSWDKVTFCVENRVFNCCFLGTEPCIFERLRQEVGWHGVHVLKRISGDILYGRIPIGHA